MTHIYDFFLLLGGIGLFLFGINFMTASLEQAAGDNLGYVLQKLTKNRFMALGVGALATAAIQSSGATMVMTAGFVNAQLMNLSQALYVMLGATIGTTITAQIIAFDIAPIAPLIVFVGMAMYIFMKKKSVKNIGAIILGFGVLFTGIYLMSNAVEAMELGSLVKTFLMEVSNPFLSFLFGFVLTFIIQSCSASVGILQVIVGSSAGLVFGLSDVVYMILGMNIGALAPLILSSLGGNKAAKRVTWVQVAGRLLAAVAFALLVIFIPKILTFVEGLSPLSPERQIANLHLLFNIFGALFVFPLIGPMSKKAMQLAPDNPDAEFESKKLIYVTSDFSKSPATIVDQAKMEVLRFGMLCVKNIKTAIECFFTNNAELTEDIFERESTIDFLQKELNEYLAKLYDGNLSGKAFEKLSAMFTVIADFERIGDHAENIAEYEAEIRSLNAVISPMGMADLKKIADKTIEMLDLSLEIFKNEEVELYPKAEAIEQEVDELKELLRENHVERLKQNICDPRGGIIYIDLVSNLERCSDHAMNIADSILGFDELLKKEEIAQGIYKLN